MAKTKKQKVFVAYSKKDLDVMNELLGQLVSLERSEDIDLWYEGKIIAGTEHKKELKAELNRADIILVLVSSNFISSDYCYNTVLKEAMLCAKKPKVKLIPILAKPCLWKNSLLGQFKALPPKDIPIVDAKWSTKEEPYLQIVMALSDLLEGRSTKTKTKKENTKPDPGEITITINDGSGKTNSGETEKSYLDKGKSLYRQKKYEAALNCFEKALTINPRNESAYYNKGQSLRMVGRMEEALEAYEMTIAINPAWWRGYLGKARYFENLKKYPEAMQYYQRAIKAEPKEGSSYFRLGRILHASKRYSEAIANYDLCIKNSPDFDAAYTNKAVILRNQGKVKEAIKLYQIAASINPSHALIFFNLGNAYLDLRKYKLALKNYEIALQLNPNDKETKRLIEETKKWA